MKRRRGDLRADTSGHEKNARRKKGGKVAGAERAAKEKNDAKILKLAETGVISHNLPTDEKLELRAHPAAESCDNKPVQKRAGKTAKNSYLVVLPGCLDFMEGKFKEKLKELAAFQAARAPEGASLCEDAVAEVIPTSQQSEDGFASISMSQQSEDGSAGISMSQQSEDGYAEISMSQQSEGDGATKKSGDSKQKKIPSQVCIGSFDLQNTGPVLELDINGPSRRGVLRLEGTVVHANAPLLVLQLRPEKSTEQQVTCTGVFDKIIVFNEIFWVEASQDSAAEVEVVKVPISRMGLGPSQEGKFENILSRLFSKSE